MKARNFIVYIFFSFIIIFFSFPVRGEATALIDRISGEDRYMTAVEISKSGWDSSINVVLATGLEFPDALCAAPLAKKLVAPILLTDKTELSIGVSGELTRLGVKNAYIIGGFGAVSLDVENAINSMGIKCTRIYGSDRYNTSLEIAEYISKNFGSPSEIAVATGENFPDALSIAPIAALKEMSIILTMPSSISDGMDKYIKDHYIKKAYVVGGVGAVSDNVLNALPSPERIKGNDRYSTNAAVLTRFSSDLEFGTSYMATGREFPDALSGSALAAKTSSPIVLTDLAPEQSTRGFLEGKLSQMENLIILGGEGAVPSSPVQDIILGKKPSGEFNAASISGLNESIRLSTVQGGAGSVKLTPNALDANGTKLGEVTFEFLSSNSNIASVDSSGTVKAVSGGVCAVTVKTKNAAYEKSKVIIVNVDSKMEISDIAKLSSGVVYIEVSDSMGRVFGSGSGFIISPDGKVITNYHVMEGAHYADVILENGSKYEVDSILNSSAEKDIAILKLRDASNLPTVNLGDSRGLKIGDGVVAIGSPIGYKNTVSTGIVSGFRESDLRVGQDIQITAPISSGSSGGALFDMYGMVAGITYAVSVDGQNINFAIPIDDAKSMINSGTEVKLSYEDGTNDSEAIRDGLSSNIMNNFSPQAVGGLTLGLDDANVTMSVEGDDYVFIFLTMYRENYYNFLQSIINNKSAISNIEKWMASIGNEGVKVYSGRKIYGSLWYYDEMEGYPDVFPSEEISYDFDTDMWKVDHEVLMFTNETGSQFTFKWY